MRLELSILLKSATCNSLLNVHFFCVDGLGQHFDEGPPKTARPGEIIAYYKIASEISSTSS